MKELSIEQKAQRYDEALKRAEKLYERGTITESLGHVFPELAGSEDEKIRKTIIRFFKDQYSNETEMYDGSVTVGKAIAWLEKQGEQKQELLTKEKALKNSPFVEQKPADKVEPMFHEGDWVVQGCNILKIRCVGDEYYCYETVGGYVDDMLVSEIDSLYHLWTIQDAKDGDVLSDGTTIFIFKDLLSDGSVMSYCDYDTDSGDSDAFCPLSVNLMCSKITPTTKEQRDLLFSKMKDANYEWDAEKKELKKCEQIQAIDYPDNLPKDNWELVHEFVEKFGRIPEDEDELNVLVEYVLKRQKTWGEEDNKWFESLIQTFEDGYLEGFNQLKSYGAISWLKFLKQRYTWKPSDEQMDALDDAIAICSERDYETECRLDNLRQNLKKLKG